MVKITGVPRQGELPTVGSLDALLTELNALDDNAPTTQGGKLFSLN